MDKRTYLKRIGIQNEDLKVSVKALKLLHKQHLLNIPFENLDIRRGAEIRLDTGDFYRKIVEKNRGGFCYELNGLFSELLRGFGFETKMVSARVANAAGKFGPEYDHMAIIAKIDGKEYLADVGFGDFIADPLRFEIDIEQSDPNGKFKIEEFEDDYFVVKKQEAAEWIDKYIFKTVSRELVEFSEMCLFQQTSPESHFTKGNLCSLMMENGRKTLTDNAFIQNSGGRKEERGVASEAEFESLLEREFNISLSL
ncbi:MAG: arylamine N-acetyltransferase [Acidobacteria bacterium]|nr:arylamine N-acetyltransferase [Acidobacteriota bacterium]